MKIQKMKLGVFTAMMVEGRVFDGTGRKLPAMEFIPAIAKAGYQGIEWAISDSYALTPAMAEKEAEKLRDCAQSHGLTAIGITGPPVKDADAMKRYLEIATRLGAPMMRVNPTPYGFSWDDVKKVNYHELFKENSEWFAKALEIAMPYGIRLLIETHFGFLCSSAALAHRFLSPFDARQAGVIYDPANLVVEGGERWKLGMELLGDYLAHVHVKNIQWSRTRLDWQEHVTDKEHWQWQLVSLPKGQVDWREVIESLQIVGYRGWLALEEFSTRPLNEKLNEAKVFLDELLKGASGN